MGYVEGRKKILAFITLPFLRSIGSQGITLAGLNETPWVDQASFKLRVPTCLRLWGLGLKGHVHYYVWLLSYLKIILIFIYMYVCMCVPICYIKMYTCVRVSVEATRGRCAPWSWSYGLWATRHGYCELNLVPPMLQALHFSALIWGFSCLPTNRGLSQHLFGRHPLPPACTPRGKWVK